MSSPIDTASVAIVPDFSRFAREARAGIDAALRGLVADVDRAFAGVERAAGEAGADIGREFQQGGESAERALREVDNQARRSFNEVSRQATQASVGISAKLGGALAAVKTGLAALAIGAGVGLAALTGFGLKAAAQLEQVQVSFNSLLGSVEVGQAVFKDLQKFSAETPFEFPEVAAAAQKFLAFNDAIGMTDAQLRPFLTTLGDITSVTGAGAEGMARVTLALGQIASRGKVSLEEINQISEALPGFSGVAAIAAATGKTTAQVMQEISSGSLDATTGVAALLQGMQKFPGAAGAMVKQSQTLLGVFSTFKDTLSQTLVTAFEPVIPAIKDSLTQVTPILQDALSGLAPVLGGVLSAVLPLVGQLVQGITPILAPIVEGLGEAFKALGPSLKPLGLALGKVVAALAPLFPVIGEVAAALADALVPVIEALAPVIAELAPALVDVVKAFLPLVPVLGELLAALGPVLVPIAQLLALLVSLLANKAVAPLIQLLATVIGFLAEAVRQFGVWLQTINWGEVASAIGGFFADAWRHVVDFFEGIGRWFADLPGKARAGFELFKAAIIAKAEEVMAFVRSIPGRIGDALGNLGGLLLNAGKDLVRGLWNGISSLGGWLWSQVRKFAIDNTVGAFKKALGIASPSMVFADEVGRQIPAGIAAGVEAELPALRSMLNSLVPTGAATQPAASTLGGVTINLGGVHFAGVVPTEAEARRTGAAAMAGAVDVLRRRDLALAVRTT
jgi:tape measure domain-containing protein